MRGEKRRCAHAFWIAAMVQAGALAACGGGGGTSAANGSSSGGSSPASEPASSPTATTYSISGTASGLVGPGLVLQVNGANDLAVDVNGGFTFSPQLGSGAAYTVTVKAQPTGQLCEVSQGGTGAAGTGMPSLSVSCAAPTTSPSANTYRLGGAISGLTGEGLVLRQGSQVVAVSPGTNTFLFPSGLSSGSAFDVAVDTQPTSQTCTVANATGTMPAADVTAVSVTCVSPPPTVQSGLSLTTASLSFSAEEGQSIPEQTLSGAITGVTGPVYVNATYTTQGLTYATFVLTSASTGELRITPKLTTFLGAGTYSDTITVAACFDTACSRHLPGSPRVVPVTYTVSAPHPAPVILLSEKGVAFTSIPGSAQLVKPLTVQDSSDAASSWTASADASWLNVTASGTSGGTLTLTANPVGLAPGQYLTTVTVRSSNAAITAPQTVRVGLYVSTSASATTMAQPLINGDSAIGDTTDAMDPIRPLLYSASGPTIAANHVHAGHRVGTLTLTGSDLGMMAVSDDGSRLYVVDYAQVRVIVVNLDTWSVVGSYGFPQLIVNSMSLRASRIAFARIQGQPVLLMTNGLLPLGTQGGQRGITPVFKADTGEMVGELAGGSSYDRIAVSRNGRVAYTAEAGLSGVLSPTRMDLRANSVGNLYGRGVTTSWGLGLASLQDFAVSPDGSRVVLVYGSSLSIYEAVYNAANQRLDWSSTFADFMVPSNVITNGVTSAGNVEFSPYGNDLFANFTSYDLRLYDAQSAPVKQWVQVPNPTATAVTGVSASVKVTSDGLRVVGNGAMFDIRP